MAKNSFPVPQLPLPHLKRMMVLGQASGLDWMAKTRKECGVPLDTPAVGRGLGEFKHDHLGDYARLGEFVNHLRIGVPQRSWSGEPETRF